MAGEVISPNMMLPVPAVGVTEGPQFASDINNCMSIIDQHDHSADSGVQINPAGININSALAFNGNNLTLARSVRFQPQVSALALPSDIGCLYEAGVDLYYNDGSGNQIRITQGGAVTGAAGTITGLPSGTASASFAAGVFTFQASTNTPANIDGGSHVFRNNLANSKGLTLSPPNAMGADYSLVLPALPASQKIMTLDATGNMSAPYDVDNSTIEISSNNLQVKNLGITAAKIANGTITGTQVSSNINLPGTAVKANSQNVITSNTNATVGLSIIRGMIGGGATILTGEGFTAVRLSAGEYVITFDVAFVDIPAVTTSSVVSGSGSGQAVAMLATQGTITASSVRLQNFVDGSPADAIMSFIAIGQKA